PLHRECRGPGRASRPALAHDHGYFRVRRDSQGDAVMNNGIALVIESLVAILLALTIGYCWLLNRRLLKLRSDESALKATIAELVTATDIAGRAISGLKQAVHDCDTALGERLRRAEEISRHITE